MQAYTGNTADEKGAVVLTGADILTSSFDVVVTKADGSRGKLAKGVSFGLGKKLLREYAGQASVSLVPSTEGA